MTESAPQNENVDQGNRNSQDLHSIEAEVAAAQAELDAARAKLEEIKANRDAQEKEQAEPLVGANNEDSSDVVEATAVKQEGDGQGIPLPPPPSEAVEAKSGVAQTSVQSGYSRAEVSSGEATQQDSSSQPSTSQQDYYWQQPPAQEQPQGQPQGQQYYTPPQTQQSYPYQTQTPSPYQATTASKDHIVAGLLAIFLGGLGIHKFYLGYNTSALIMLAVSILGGAITFMLAVAVVWVIAIVEGIIYLTKSQPDFEQTYVFNKREWF